MKALHILVMGTTSSSEHSTRCARWCRLDHKPDLLEWLSGQPERQPQIHIWSRESMSTSLSGASGKAVTFGWINFALSSKRVVKQFRKTRIVTNNVTIRCTEHRRYRRFVSSTHLKRPIACWVSLKSNSETTQVLGVSVAGHGLKLLPSAQQTRTWSPLKGCGAGDGMRLPWCAERPAQRRRITAAPCSIMKAKCCHMMLPYAECRPPGLLIQSEAWRWRVRVRVREPSYRG